MMKVFGRIIGLILAGSLLVVPTGCAAGSAEKDVLEDEMEMREFSKDDKTVDSLGTDSDDAVDKAATLIDRIDEFYVEQTIPVNDHIVDASYDLMGLANMTKLGELTGITRIDMRTGLDSQFDSDYKVMYETLEFQKGDFEFVIESWVAPNYIASSLGATDGKSGYRSELMPADITEAVMLSSGDEDYSGGRNNVVVTVNGGITVSAELFYYLVAVLSEWDEGYELPFEGGNSLPYEKVLEDGKEVSIVRNGFRNTQEVVKSVE